MSLQEKIVAVVKFKDEISYYRSKRADWILDLNKLRQAYIDAGYSMPELDDSDRFGIHSIADNNFELFLQKMEPKKIQKDTLSLLLAKKFPSAHSWWDVGEIFPTIFVDFDRKVVGAFYYEGTKMEVYIPNEWKGEFIDFSNDYPEEVFPKSEKFWIKGDSDLLQILNERGRSK
ncbi:hypothetical protein ACJJIW_13325 [Microbulbifer sp. JMSA004]|uniref:hypothetical protein n=1 Tax=Microbulbifer sp. JMSA004 TaxID=3243370 RepID=UPI00403A2B0C